jgi:hypothetical protein
MLDSYLLLISSKYKCQIMCMVWTGHICDIGVFVVGNSDQYGLYLFPFLEMHNIFLLGNKYFFV